MPALVDIPRRRSDIVRAVTDLALEGGLAAVTLRAVAERVGVSTSAVRATCPTRERLLDITAFTVARERATQRRFFGFSGAALDGSGLAAALLPRDEGERRRERLWLMLEEDPATSDVRRRAVAEERAEEGWMVSAAAGLPDRRETTEVLLLLASIDGLRRMLTLGHGERDSDLSPAVAVLERALETSVGENRGDSQVSDR